MSDQSDQGTPTGRILQGSSGLGTVSEDMVEDRARELAKMDGRTEVNEGDLANARDELTSTVGHFAAPETIDSDTESLTSWDEAPEATGTRAPRLYGDEKSSIAETLIEEGLEEADHDQRLSAANENPPKEI